MKRSKIIEESEGAVPSAGLNLSDIYYVLFRRRWLILVCSVLGLVLAALMFAFRKPVYQSEAKLLVRYVLETKSVTPGGAPATGSDPSIRSPDARGESIINSEVQILTSSDLAEQVSTTVGPEKVLAKAGGGNNRHRAASVILKGLTVDVPLRSTIIRLVFQHPDPEVVQPILTQLIDGYFKKHVEVHRGIGGFDQFLSRQTDELRTRLMQTEKELKEVKSKAGVISLVDSKRLLTEHIARIQQELVNAEAELTDRQAVARRTGSATATNTQPATATPAVSADLISEYRAVVTRLVALRNRESDLFQLTEENPLMKALRAQIMENEKQKKKLEAEHPDLLVVEVPDADARNRPAGRLADVNHLTTPELESKVRILRLQREQFQVEAAAIDEVEVQIAQLQRKKDLEEANYKYFSAGLEQAKFDEALGAGKMSNISIVQAPSPPVADASKLLKPLAMTAGGGIALGLALAFMLELLVDQTVRRPGEVEVRLRQRLFLSIPSLTRDGKRGSGGGAASSGLPPKGRWRRLLSWRSRRKSGLDESGAERAKADVSTEIAPWEASHSLSPYFEALRDRLMTWFEVRNMVHKPKLVGVTSCSKGSGVTTLATGLAASLSKTGEGRVLLVDMNLENGAAHPFFRGKPGCGLSDALEGGSRESAQVEENLYLASGQETNHGLPRVLPKRFAHLVPKMKASDYDYVIIDLPPVNQMNVTPRLASMLDMVFLVVESEKTNRDLLKKAGALLAESGANTAVVLNKYNKYIPDKLLPEL